MPVALIIVCFGLGVGLMGLGAFFLWQWWRSCGGMWNAVLIGILPVCMMVIIALWFRQTEIAVAILLGTVGINLALIGLINSFSGLRTSQSYWSNGLSLTMALGACLLSAHCAVIGIFSGVALLLVGIVAVWQELNKVKHDKSNDSQLRKSLKISWQKWLVLLLSILVVIVGCCLLLWQRMLISAVLSWSLSLFGIVLALLMGMLRLTGLRRNCPVHNLKLLHGLWWENVLLVCFGLGLMAIFLGGIRLAQSITLVVLPWLMGIALLTLSAMFLPKKIARIWNSLIVVLYIFLIICLF